MGPTIGVVQLYGSGSAMSDFGLEAGLLPVVLSGCGI